MQKKVFFYCQHSMGIGHLIRSFALINSLKKAFGVTLVSGGDFPKGIKIPKGITFVQLPPIGIDDKNHLTAIGTNESAYEVIKIRQKKLINLFKEIQPDIFITEYFPLGKIQFMGELLPILKFIESNNLPIQVMCSSRDILEPKSIAKPLIGDFGVKIINDYYSRVLVHGDKNFIDLGETFTQLKRIEVPISYTGYVSDEKYVPKINRENFNEIVLSAGGGKVAQPFIIKMVNSFKKFGFGEGNILRVITGPIYPKEDWIVLQESVKNNSDIILNRSVENLSTIWKQARLSISPGGYNTLMEVICSRIPALIVPYCNETNSEQEIRAIKLQKEGLVETINLEKSSEEQIAIAVKKALNFVIADKELNLNGAENTRIILEQKI